MHFLSSAEVFSIFPIITPIGKSPNKKAVKVRCIPLRPKDFLIFRTIYTTLLGFVKQSFIKGLPAAGKLVARRRRLAAWKEKQK
jgi:hypothetical protein